MADQSVRTSLASLQSKMGPAAGKSGLKTVVDLVFVIDGTGSMQNALDAVKDRAMTLYKDIIKGLDEKNRKVSKMRVKVIVFRDLYVDANAYEESDYFTLSGQDDDDSYEFKRFVEGIRATGGGDEPEHALEALHHAMNLDYMPVMQGLKGRHIIVMMTDASAHPLDDPQRSLPEYRDIYPSDMPRSMMELQCEWEDAMDEKCKRLIIFAPNSYPWTTLSTWNQTTLTPSEAGKGISEAMFEQVIATICGSVA